MTTVRFLNAARYAVKLFGYLVAVVIVSTGAVSLGYWIAYPEVSPALGSGTPEYAPLVGGAVLILVGVVVFWIGTLSATYKMIADAVTAGRENVAEPTADTAEVESESVETAVEEPATGGTEEGTTGVAGGAAASSSEQDVAAAAREGAREAQAATPAEGEEAGVAESASEQSAEAAAELGSETAAEQATEPAEPPTEAEPETGSGSGEEGGALVEASPTGEPDRETNPDPPDRETTPEPKWETESEPTDRETTPQPDWETTPESPERETSPEPHDRETNPSPPDSDGRVEESRPEPSAEEIAFGSSGGGDTGSEEAPGGSASGGSTGTDSEDSSESSLDDAWGSLDADDEDLMWGQAGDEDAGDFEEGSNDADVDAVQPDSGKDPLADE